jgi:trehalose/maltose hydrolase-like predicted phosphorylase
MGVVLRFALVVVLSVAQQPPADWAARVAAGQMLFSRGIPAPGMMPSIGNGNIAGTVSCAAKSEASSSPSPPPPAGSATFGGAQPEWSGVMYMAGMFNGHGKGTQRAQLPGVHSLLLQTSAAQEVSSVGAALDLARGVFYNRTRVVSPSCPAAAGASAAVEVEQAWFAHRSRKELLVHTVTVTGAAAGANCTLLLDSCNANPTPRKDFNLSFFRSNGSGGGGCGGSGRGDEPPSTLHGTTLAAEQPGGELARVAAAYEAVPAAVTLPDGGGPDGAPRGRRFLAAWRSTAEAAAQRNASAAALLALAQDSYADSAALPFAPGTAAADPLLDEHIAAWAAVYEGGVEVAGNLTVAASVNSSLYAILNALHADVPQGISVGGLATNAYGGHSFWDCETWMFPNLNTFHPALAASLLQYRAERLPAALAWAAANNNSGTQWPWESAATGAPVAAYLNEDMYEQHITGDIALAFRFYWHATRDDRWLGEQAWPVLAGSCDFFAGRATPVPAPVPPAPVPPPPQSACEDVAVAARIDCGFRGITEAQCRARRCCWNTTSSFHECYNSSSVRSANLTLLHVIGPDELAHIVDSNAYTNGLAQTTLRFCGEAASVLLSSGGSFSGGAPTPAQLARWADVAERMWLPLSSTLYTGGPVHPEFAGYAGKPINQADVALLQYPLDLTAAMGREVATNDLAFYQGLSSQKTTSGFYTGDSAYSIAWLALGNRSAADAQLRLAFEHMDLAHFHVWSEVAHGGVTSGHSNFLTGAGGYVQNIVNGYAGLRYSAAGLRLLPLLPPDGVSSVVLRGMSFAGCRLTVAYDGSTLCATLLRCGSAVSLELCRNGGGATVLELEKTVVLPRADGDMFTVTVKK